MTGMRFRFWPIVLTAMLVVVGASSAAAVIEQAGTLRVKVDAGLRPSKLPRDGTAPISVSIDGQVSTTDNALPPRLRLLKIEINRNGHLEYRGLPVCRYSRIQPATDERALESCRPSLVGQGKFSAYILLRGQPPYLANGRLLVFNGRQGNRQVLFGHVYLSKPFASSFILTFQIDKSGKGSYGTVLTANLDKALGSRRYVTGIDLTLSRRYRAAGESRSYLRSGCPALKGFGKALFPLVRTTFSFAGGKILHSTQMSTCHVRG
jgi:hypothetical protein